MQPTSDELDQLTQEIIGHAMEVHTHLGPGFPEAVYEESLARELERNELQFERQVSIQAIYKGEKVGSGVADLIVESRVIVELKAISELAAIHRAQLYSYLRMTGSRLGLLINFNTKMLRDGLKRVINS